MKNIIHTKKVSLFLLSLTFPVIAFAHGSVGNSKEVLVRNRVFSEVEELCYGNCIHNYTEFDGRGNVVLFRPARSSTTYASKYNKAGEIVEEYRISSGGTDTIRASEYPDMYPKSTHKKFNSQGKIISKRLGSIEVSYHYNEDGRIKEEKQVQEGRKVFVKKFYYNKNGFLSHTVSFKYYGLFLYFWRNIKTVIPRYIDIEIYNKKGQITTSYSDFEDPCASLIGLFKYEYTYHKNGLLERVEATPLKENAFGYALKYEYTFRK